MKESGLHQVGRICAILVGLAFIVSGFAKSVDATFFANTIAGYGVDWFGYLSPVIIVYEVLLGGFLLVTDYHRRLLLILSIFSLVGFTAIYTYGFLLKDIDSCGCFGNIPFINDGPVLLYVKNTLLIAFALCGLNYASTQTKQPKMIECVTVALLVVAVSFMAGQTFSPMKSVRNDYKAIALKDSELRRFVAPLSDKTQLVFLFSYSCPHCLNSIANLHEYRNCNRVDTIIALAVGSNNEADWFKENFKVGFKHETVGNDLFNVTTKFPHAYLIKGDSILMEFSGELPCHQLFPFP